MDKTAKTIVGVIIALIVIGGAYALFHKQDGGSGSTANTSNDIGAGDTYKLGVILPLTGDAASYGEPARDVYQLAVEEINKNGGVNGKNLELVVEDGKCNGKDAANAMQKLTGVDKVQVVIGGFCSSESLASVPIAESAKVALFSAASSSPDLTGKSLYFSRDYPSDASQGSVLAEVANKEGVKKIAFLQEQQDYALGIYKAFTARFQELGGTVIKEEYPKDATDFRSQLAKLKGENPDALFIDAQTPQSAARALKQFSDLQWKPKLFLPDIVPGDPQTLIDNKIILEGAFAAEFGVDPANPKMKALLDNYKAKYGKDLIQQAYGQTEYDAVYIVADAIKAVGYNGSKIAPWLQTVSNWPGASGSVTIGSNGDLVGGHHPEVIKDGKATPYN